MWIELRVRLTRADFHRSAAINHSATSSIRFSLFLLPALNQKLDRIVRTEEKRIRTAKSRVKTMKWKIFGKGGKTFSNPVIKVTAPRNKASEFDRGQIWGGIKAPAEDRHVKV